MALEHAILVSLVEREGSGYELARRFDRSIGFFWSASHQQIYRVLARMEAAGWVTATAVAQQGRPDKKVYVVSREGRAELTRWMSQASDPEPTRVELAVKIRAAGFSDPAPVVAEVERHRKLHAERLELFRAIQRHDFTDPEKLSRADRAQYLVLRGGILAEEGWLAWCDEVLDGLGPRRRTR